MFWKLANTQISIGSLATYFIFPAVLVIVLAFRKFFVDMTRYTTDGILYIAARVVTSRLSSFLSLRSYCRMQLSGQSKFLSVPGIKDTSLDIDRIFVPLILERSGSNEVYEYRSALSSGSRIRIIGDPGSGKSSCSRRLFRDECRLGATHIYSPARLPILIELKRIEIPKNIPAKKLGEWFYNYIRSTVTNFKVYAIEKCFESFVSNKGILLILDGLDEVSSQSYDRIEASILQLSYRLQEAGLNNKIVLTMRTQFHSQIRSSYVDSFPVVLELRRFSSSDIFQFLTRWPFPDPRKREDIVRIYNELTDQPALREMCTNPLVLAMYVARDQAVGEQLAPESRAQFYFQVTEELLIRRRAKQVGASQAQTLIREQRQRILGRIAFVHLCDSNSPANLIAWRDGVAIAEAYSGMSFDDSETLLRTIAKDTGLISEDREGETFRFIHLTFCEFLAAMEVVHGLKDGWERLMAQHQSFRSDVQARTRLIEVIPFAAALIPSFRRSEVVSTIARSDDNRTVALTFLETKLYDNVEWPNFIKNYSYDLLQRVNNNCLDQDWLRDMHLFLVIAADAERARSYLSNSDSSSKIEVFFQSLLHSGTEMVPKLITGFAEQDASVAFRVAELCGLDVLKDLPDVIIDNLDQPSFMAVTLEKAWQSRNPNLWASLFAEAGLRSEGTAALLMAAPERPWKTLAEALPRQHQWRLRNIIPSSTYSDCLALAHAGDERDITNNLHLVSVFRKLTAPGQCITLPVFMLIPNKKILSVIYVIFLTVYIPILTVYRPTYGMISIFGLTLRNQDVHVFLELFIVISLFSLWYSHCSRLTSGFAAITNCHWLREKSDSFIEVGIQNLLDALNRKGQLYWVKDVIDKIESGVFDAKCPDVRSIPFRFQSEIFSILRVHILRRLVLKNFQPP